MSRDRITIDGVTMSPEAAKLVAWAGVNVNHDLASVIRANDGGLSLLAECLEEADPAHHGDWGDYVAAVVEAAEGMKR